MNQYHIDEIIELLKQTPLTLESVKDALTKWSSDKMSAVWMVNDVFGLAAQDSLYLSEGDCRSILDRLDTEHDANLGICWDTIQLWIDNDFEDRLEQLDNDGFDREGLTELCAKYNRPISDAEFQEIEKLVSEAVDGESYDGTRKVVEETIEKYFNAQDKI